MAYTELVYAQTGTESKSTPGMKALRDSIPNHCFERSALTSLGYIISDLCLAAALFIIGNRIPLMDDALSRFVAWSAYGAVQGAVFTGIWILAHECGHGALFKQRRVNNSFGYVLHTFLLVPYFSWKYSHARHHRYANNMATDTAFVPPRTSKGSLTRHLAHALDMGEDAPLLNLVILLGHQLVGMPLYFLCNVTAGERSLQKDTRSTSNKQSHFDPTSDVFTSQEHPFVLLTDIGFAAMLLALWRIGATIGFTQLFLLYGVPYLWVNHWIVAITFLHHTHPSASHFEPESWTFQKGALMTVDRDFGFVGKHVFHGIIEFHVIHHLFPRIPFYHAEEATQHVQAMLGQEYLRDDTPFMTSLWKTFTTCKYVEALPGSCGELKWNVARQ